jgi:ribonuclease R
MLDDTCAEGFLPVRALGDEWFAFHEEHMRLVGESTGRSWRIGQRVAVKVDGVEIARGRIDLVLAARP